MTSLPVALKRVPGARLLGRALRRSRAQSYEIDTPFPLFASELFVQLRREVVHEKDFVITVQAWGHDGKSLTTSGSVWTRSKSLGLPYAYVPVASKGWNVRLRMSGLYVQPVSRIVLTVQSWRNAAASVEQTFGLVAVRLDASFGPAARTYERGSVMLTAAARRNGL